MKIPEIISVGEAAEILNITPQMVRRRCKTGELTCEIKSGYSGKLRVVVDDKIITKPEWSKYLSEFEKRKSDSLAVVNLMISIIEEKEKEHRDT